MRMSIFLFYWNRLPFFQAIVMRTTAMSKRYGSPQKHWIHRLSWPSGRAVLFRSSPGSAGLSNDDLQGCCIARDSQRYRVVRSVAVMLEPWRVIGYTNEQVSTRCLPRFLTLQGTKNRDKNGKRRLSEAL